MKLISLWEPWASAMALGFKKNETRDWSIGYTGWLAIHASKGGLPQRDLRKFSVQEPFHSRFHGVLLPDPKTVYAYPRGHIVAVVKLIACVPVEKLYRPGFNLGSVDSWLSLGPVEEACGNYEEGRFAWITQKLFRLPEPIPFKAHQGLCDVPADTLALIQAQWKAGRTCQ